MSEQFAYFFLSSNWLMLLGGGAVGCKKAQVNWWKWCKVQRRWQRWPLSFVSGTICLHILYFLYSSEYNSFIRYLFFGTGKSEKLFRSNGPLKQFSATSDFVRDVNEHEGKRNWEKLYACVLMEGGEEERVWNRCVGKTLKVEKWIFLNEEFVGIKR